MDHLFESDIVGKWEVLLNEAERTLLPINPQA
jgi:hypothetical protein